MVVGVWRVHGGRASGLECSEGHILRCAPCKALSRKKTRMTKLRHPKSDAKHVLSNKLPLQFFVFSGALGTVRNVLNDWFVGLISAQVE